MNPFLLCPDAIPSFLGFFDISIAPTLLFYSYFPIVITSLFLSIFVLFKDKFSLQSKLLLLVTLSFSVWMIDQVIQWVAAYTAIVHFSWQIIAFLEILIPIFSIYFIAVFLNKKDIDFKYKLLLGLVFLPIIVLLPTQLNITSFDLLNCQSNFSFLWDYIYLVEVVSIVVIMDLCFRKFRSLAKGDPFRKQIVILALGIFLFLGMFTATNILGDSTLVYEFNLIGPIGMVAFVALLAFMIVRYKTFNIKLIGAQALIVSLVVLIGSEFFFIQSNTNRILTAITLVITGVIGLNLIRSVKKEVAQREHIEKLAGELQTTNERQDTLLHFIGHEVKGSLAKDAGVFASLSDGDFGKLPVELKPFVERALIESRQGAASVENILKASNLKKGTVTYTKAPFELKALVSEAVEKARSMATEKKLALSFLEGDSGTPYIFNGDKAQISDHVLRNLIDNSINYTQSGSVAVSLKKENGKFVISVKDTGIGITEEDKKLLFTEGGHGKDSQKVNVHSTGYGLYIAKNIVEAHGGTIRAESEGEGKGATFIVELPV